MFKYYPWFHLAGMDWVVQTLNFWVVAELEFSSSILEHLNGWYVIENRLVVRLCCCY